MLRLRVELIPYGDESKVQDLALLNIGNTLEREGRWDYIYKYEGYWRGVDNIQRSVSGLVKHDRLNVMWILIYKVLAKIIATPSEKYIV